MEVKAAGGGARAGDNHGQVLGDRLAAERELKTISGPLMTSSGILMWTLAWTAAVPPQLVSRAREAGEQLFRAPLFSFLSTFAFVQAVAVVVLLCIYQMGAVPAEHTLSAVRMLFLAAMGSMVAGFTVISSESWGETASMFAIAVASAAIAVLCALGKLKIGKAFSWFI